MFCGQGISPRVLQLEVCLGDKGMGGAVPDPLSTELLQVSAAVSWSVLKNGSEWVSSRRGCYHLFLLHGASANWECKRSSQVSRRALQSEFREPSV